MACSSDNALTKATPLLTGPSKLTLSADPAAALAVAGAVKHWEVSFYLTITESGGGSATIGDVHFDLPGVGRLPVTTDLAARSDGNLIEALGHVVTLVHFSFDGTRGSDGFGTGNIVVVATDEQTQGVVVSSLGVAVK